MFIPNLFSYVLSLNCLLQGYIGLETLRCKDLNSGDRQVSVKSSFKMPSKGFFTSDDMAKMDIEILHDFGRGYDTDQFEPAILRGKTVNVDGQNKTRPFVWGEEKLRIELPRLSVGDNSELWESPSISISRSQSRLAASYGYLVTVYQLPDWQRIVILHHSRHVGLVSFSPDGKYVLTTNIIDSELDVEDEIRIWDIEAEVSRQNREDEEPHQRADMDHVHKLMMQATKDALLQYEDDWNQDSWMTDANDLLTKKSRELLFDVERHHLSSAGENTVTTKLRVTHYTPNPWSPDGTSLLYVRKWEEDRIPLGTNGEPGDLIVWDMKSNKEGMQLEEPGHSGPIMWSGFSPDGKWIASSSWDSKVRIWDATTGKIHFHLQNGKSESQSWTGRFSPDSKHIAVGSGDGNLRIWKIATGEVKHQVKVKDGQGWIRGIEFTSDSQSVFFSDGSGNVQLYSLVEEQIEQQYLVETSFEELHAVQASADGKSFGFRRESGQMTVYQSSTNEKWQVEQTLEEDRGLRESVFGTMRFLDDQGKQVVSSDNDGILRIWQF